MKRTWFAWLLMGTAFLWLLFSYLPPETIPWQIVPNARWLPLSRNLVLASGLLVIVIQLILVAAVFRFPAQVAPDEEEGQPIQIRRGWELVWTALPLVALVGLFVLSYWSLRS